MSRLPRSPLDTLPLRGYNDTMFDELLLLPSDPDMLFFVTIFYTMVIGFFGLAAYDLLSRLKG